MAQQVAKLISNNEDAGSLGSFRGLSQWVKGSGIAVSCWVGHRHSSDPALLWLWCRLAAAALIQPLAWEPPCATGVALKMKEREEGRKKRKKEGREGEREKTIHRMGDNFCKSYIR